MQESENRPNNLKSLEMPFSEKRFRCGKGKKKKKKGGERMRKGGSIKPTWVYAQPGRPVEREIHFLKDGRRTKVLGDSS